MDQEKSIRAERAKQLLDDPLMIEAFRVIEIGAYDELLRVSGVDADRKRAELIDRINTIRAVKIALRGVIADSAQANKPRIGVA